MTERLLRLPDVMRKTGASRASVQRWVRAGLFPRPVRLGPSAVAWRESDLDAWIAELEPTKPASARAAEAR